MIWSQSIRREERTIYQSSFLVAHNQVYMGYKSSWGMESLPGQARTEGTKTCTVMSISINRNSPWSELFPEPHLGSVSEVTTSFQQKAQAWTYISPTQIAQMQDPRI